MLLSLLILAVAGGTMAFKVKFSDQFCTTVAQQDPTANYFCASAIFACPLLKNVMPTNNPSVIPVCTTSTSGIVGAECVGKVDCTILTRLIID